MAARRLIVMGLGIFLFVSVLALRPLSVAAQSGGSGSGATCEYHISLAIPGTNGNTCYNSFKDYFLALINWAITIAQALAVVMVLRGAFIYTTSGGDQAKAKDGKDFIVGALVGFALLLLIKVLIPIIGV